MNPSENIPMECGNCSFKDRWLLHYVRLRGEHRRLCTSCVLKLHPGSFCSTCFELFEGSVPHHERVICQKCPSITHTSCVPNSDNVGKSYTCPPCSDSSFAFFDVKRNSDQRLEIDLKSSKVLLCAARIAAESMTRAVNMAEADAFRRVKEATVSRKRAKEALEEICAMVSRDKARKLREDSSAGGSADRNGVGSSSRDRIVAGSSAPGSGNVGLQSKPMNRGLVLGSSGNSNIVRGDDKRGKSSNGDVGRNLPSGNGGIAGASARPTNVHTFGNTSIAGGNRGSSLSGLAEDGKS
uniref:Uncharacterized protein n=1 Tax=Kalanchoe fedtschenkoi TaxID=63787 RepID=A0A7N0U8Y8_KALFE